MAESCGGHGRERENLRMVSRCPAWENEPVMDELFPGDVGTDGEVLSSDCIQYLRSLPSSTYYVLNNDFPLEQGGCHCVGGCLGLELWRASLHGAEAIVVPTLYCFDPELRAQRSEPGTRDLVWVGEEEAFPSACSRSRAGPKNKLIG